MNYSIDWDGPGERDVIYPLTNLALRKSASLNEICPECGGALDTGWECNECGFDAKPLVEKQYAIKGRPCPVCGCSYSHALNCTHNKPAIVPKQNTPSEDSKK